MRHIPKIRGAHGRHQSDSTKDGASKWKAFCSLSGRTIAYGNLYRQLILPSRVLQEDVRKMRERGVPAHGASAIDPSTRAMASCSGPSLGVGLTSGSAELLIRSGYIKKAAPSLSCRGKIYGTASRLIVGALALLHPGLRYLPRCPTNIEWQYFKSVPPVLFFLLLITRWHPSTF